MVTTSEVDLIVVDSGGGEGLTTCLQAIDAQTHPPARVIIIDNATLRPIYLRLPEKILKVPYTITRLEANTGLGPAINRAMSDVRAAFVAWVSTDVTLGEKWIEKLLPAVSGEGKIAGAQSIVLRDKTTVENAGIALEHGVFRAIGAGQKLARLKKVTQPWGISSAAAIFRTHALAEVAGTGPLLHSERFAHYEDVDLAVRLRARGWKFKLVPEALAMRREPRLGASAFRAQVRNRYVVARAHPGTASAFALLGDDLTMAFVELVTGRASWAAERLRGVGEAFRRR